MKVIDIINLLKIKYYIKNLVVFIPLLCSLNLINTQKLINSFSIFTAFCLISSTVYILNDLIDIEEDKKHPIKKNRLIASEKITKKSALLVLIILLLLSLIISYKINIYCLLSVLSYFILNIFYSIYLKHVTFIDIACISIGFIIRIFSGGFAISMAPSVLIILMTFFISNFFTLAKRKLEMNLLDSVSAKLSIRSSLKSLKMETINQFILINSVLSISLYITYVFINSNLQYLYLTIIPFTLVIYRLFTLVNSNFLDDNPIIFLKDKTLKYLFFFYIIIYIIICKL